MAERGSLTQVTDLPFMTSFLSAANYPSRLVRRSCLSCRYGKWIKAALQRCCSSSFSCERSFRPEGSRLSSTQKIWTWTQCGCWAVSPPGGCGGSIQQRAVTCLPPPWPSDLQKTVTCHWHSESFEFGFLGSCFHSVHDSLLSLHHSSVWLSALTSEEMLTKNDASSDGWYYETEYFLHRISC